MNQPIDMAMFTQAKSDQLNAIDIASGPVVIRITKVTANLAGDGTQPISLHYEGDNGKPFKPCLTMRRLLMKAWGRYADQWVGRSMRIFCDPEVTFGKDKTGGIRIDALSHVSSKMRMALPAAKGRFKEHTVEVLETGADPMRAKAEAWASDHVTEINGAASVDQLEAILTKGSAARGKLAANHPDLADKVNVAISQARDSFDDGKPTDAHGEQTTLVDALDALTRADTREDIDAIVNGHADLSDEDADKLRSAAMERIGEIEA